MSKQRLNYTPQSLELYDEFIMAINKSNSLEADQTTPHGDRASKLREEGL
jgi:hypothetical protein